MENRNLQLETAHGGDCALLYHVAITGIQFQTIFSACRDAVLKQLKCIPRFQAQSNWVLTCSACATLLRKEIASTCFHFDWKFVWSNFREGLLSRVRVQVEHGTLMNLVEQCSYRARGPKPVGLSRKKCSSVVILVMFPDHFPTKRLQQANHGRPEKTTEN